MWLLLSIVSCYKVAFLEVSNIASAEGQCAYISAAEITKEVSIIGDSVVTSSGDELYFCCPDEDGGVPSCRPFELKKRTTSNRKPTLNSKSTSSNASSKSPASQYQMNNKIPGFKSCTSELSGSKERIAKICCNRVGGEHINGDCKK